MGDLIEFTSEATLNLFYKIDGNSIIFGVKTAGPAILGLARRPGPKIDAKIKLHHESIVGMRHRHVTSVPTRHLLSNTETRYFWLMWDESYIKVGKLGELKSFIHHNDSVEGLNYITFGSSTDINSVNWKVEFPPNNIPPQIKPVVGGEIEWLSCDRQLPDGALIGGFENNETLYIIRAEHRGSLTPGKFVPSQGVGFISWGGRSNEKSEFQVLLGYDCSWVKTMDDRIPQGAVVGGRAETTNEPLYVGRANIDGHLIPGKVQPTHRVCYVSYKEREVAANMYEILVTHNREGSSPIRYQSNYIADERFVGLDDDEDDDDENHHMDIQREEVINF